MVVQFHSSNSILDSEGTKCLKKNLTIYLGLQSIVKFSGAASLWRKYQINPSHLSNLCIRTAETELVLAAISHSGFCQICLLSPFLFNFVIRLVMEIALSSCQKNSVVRLSDWSPRDSTQGLSETISDGVHCRRQLHSESFLFYAVVQLIVFHLTFHCFSHE